MDTTQKNTPRSKANAIRAILDRLGRTKVVTPTGTAKLSVVAETDLSYAMHLVDKMTEDCEGKDA